MSKLKLQIFLYFIFLYGMKFIKPRKVCNVLQFGSYILSSNKENKKYFKYEIVGIIDPFDKNKTLWCRKRRKKFNIHLFKNLYSSLFCNINDYVHLNNSDQFIFRIFQINLKKTIQYMLKYKVVSGKTKKDIEDKEILSLKENSFLFRFLNNINI
ncbi:conserved Plasmodium protein, unknown function [Plasmodium gallinaceum]|uniref:Uncharacterized protein n=1 Tax=Plasmodium gallinaceum TaxID=5849 RepID=A0A1J1GZ79_PLAGA|nr:conserved Plasmodium protein, unknown function [Plasmodium gallinaceum]CRG96323.1 conserved Plasmodium protein, unknown function [Plasmodium gallinaceum]